jgi:diguanylate cyclase (GGDEF)-like protein
MAAVDAARVEALEAQILQLQTVHSQLVAYAEDLNRTYHELRLRLQQMTALSDVATRLAVARTVESASRVCLDAVDSLFPGADGRVYLENRGSALKIAAERNDRLPPSLSRLCEETAKSALAAESMVHRRETVADTAVNLIAVGLAARGKTFGSLVALRSEGSFNDDDAHVVELLGHNTAAAISNIRLYEHTRRLAITDSVTKLYNPRHFQVSLGQEIQKARRFKYPIAVMMIDIDHFKAFNDTYGHVKGNVALRIVARTIGQSLRQTDTVARYGGEEFVAILPGCDHAALTQVAEKVRESVARAPIRVAAKEPPAHVTISIGAAWQDTNQAEASRLLAEADAALYMAKAQGRDRSCVRP